MCTKNERIWKYELNYLSCHSTSKNKILETKNFLPKLSSRISRTLALQDLVVKKARSTFPVQSLSDCLNATALNWWKTSCREMGPRNCIILVCKWNIAHALTQSLREGSTRGTSYPVGSIRMKVYTLSFSVIKLKITSVSQLPVYTV